MENLYIQGEPSGAIQFSVSLAPGETCTKILKPVQDGEATAIQMRFSFDLN